MLNASRAPLVEEINSLLSTLDLFALFRQRPYPFFLDSSMNPQKLGRYSFMGADPFLVMSSRGHNITLKQDGRQTVIRGNPFDVLAERLAMFRLARGDAPVPFTGGAVGYSAMTSCTSSRRCPKRR